jgi:hypothetical protein
MRRAAVITVLGLLMASVAGAQVSENPFGFHVGLVRLDLYSVYESNIDREVVPTEDYGLKAGGLFRIQSQPRDPLAYLEYRGLLQAYANTDNWDRISHRFRASMGGEPVENLELGVYGDLNTRTANEDQQLVNQFTVSPSIALFGPRSLGIQVYGAYRVRDFINVAGEDEIIRYVGVEGQTRLWMSARFTAGYRYEEADSQLPSESYFRRRIEAKLEQYIGRWDRLRVSVQYRVREYPHDLVDSGTGEVSREDRRWIPGARWTHRLIGGQQIELDYLYQDRSSNDPDKEYEAHRITLAFRWPFFR